MHWFEFISLLILAGLVWLWFDSVKVREIAVRAARNACHAEGCQFLDETVSIAHLKPERADDGHLLLRRTYRFEYSDTGDNRRPGSIVMLGQQVARLDIGLHLVRDFDPPAA